MPDLGVLIVDVGVTAVAAALAVALVVHVMRAPRTALATVGVMCLALAMLAAVWQPADSAWDAALNTIGFTLVFTSYPDGHLQPRWLAAPVAVFALVAGIDLFGGAALVASPWWQLVHLLEAGLIVVTVHRYRRRLSTPERESVRWAILGAAITFVGMPVLVVTASLSGRTVAQLGPWGEAGAAVLVAATPVALTIGLVAPSRPRRSRHRRDGIHSSHTTAPTSGGRLTSP
ncbi:hypothetical protein IF188_11065 [Microbacterium sp. NEAU-LLC]|uniref:Uncharacterized protein n=1 Tax=Microbacterium helvum TaxID=2773713 RepID=A0ABR8NT71_9MICO|nr:hypothetical protein [Microbacterium helvum]MBD3942236.1 hypothetical protein [Microbacterium helvum]